MARAEDGATEVRLARHKSGSVTIRLTSGAVSIVAALTAEDFAFISDAPAEDTIVATEAGIIVPPSCFGWDSARVRELLDWFDARTGRKPQPPESETATC